MSWDVELRGVIQQQWRLGQNFSLADVYAFEPHFAAIYPGNHHRCDKLRQILQNLREDGVIKFLDNQGHYQRVS